MDQSDPKVQSAVIATPPDVPAEVLATLAEIGEEVNASLDLDEVLAHTALLIKRHIDYEFFGVLMVDGDGSYLTFRFAVGYPPGLAENLRVPLGQGITGTAAATGHSVRVSDVTKDSRYINAIESVRSELAVPLMLRGKSTGVLDIQSRHQDYFTTDQQNILTLLASRLAVAIENARLFRKVSTQAETLLVLNEVSREISSILDVEELLRRAAELVKRVIDYQILSIMLYDEAQHVFRHRVDVKHGQRVQGKLRVAASEGIVGAAATLREPVIVPDVSVDPRYLMVNPETRSELAIPMLQKNKVIGVLDLESPQLNYFTEEHVQTLSILAANLAVSLENARLYEQVAQDEARLERDLQAAKRIQGALLRPVPSEDYGVDLAAATRYRPRRRQRQRHRRRFVWRRGDRHYAQPGPAKASARRNAKADESVGRRAPHRRAIYDRVFRHLAEGTPKTARRQCRPVATVALQRRPLRSHRTCRLPIGHLRRRAIRRMGRHPQRW
jgi:phosphoserine phosphatase RsbU/P